MNLPTQEESLQIGDDYIANVTEWRAYCNEVTAEIGVSRSDLAGETIQAIAFVEARKRKPELYDASLESERKFTALESASRHAIAKSEVRWEKMEERTKRSLEDVPASEQRMKKALGESQKIEQPEDDGA